MKQNLLVKKRPLIKDRRRRIRNAILVVLLITFLVGVWWIHELNKTMPDSVHKNIELNEN
jgi:hypothetical protein